MTAPAPAPFWLADIAEAVAGQRLDEDDMLESIPFDRWREVRNDVLAESRLSSEFYSRWARWFFMDRVSEESSRFLVDP